MVRDNGTFWAIVDAARLEHIAERHAIGDALGADFEGSGGQDIDVAMPESRARAAIFDGFMRAVVLERLGGAVVRSVLESRQHHHIGDALPDRRAASWNSS